jgi:hypothetical protein
LVSLYNVLHASALAAAVVDAETGSECDGTGISREGAGRGRFSAEAMKTSPRRGRKFSQSRTQPATMKNTVRKSSNNGKDPSTWGSQD